MKYKAILFDLDGTLLDTLEDIADSMNAVLVQSGFPAHPVDSYRTLVGDGIVNLVHRALPEERRNDKTVSECVASMRDEYSRRWDNKSRPFPGVEEMLNRLTEIGAPISIFSNKPHDFTILTVEKLLPHWSFLSVQGIREGNPMKPDPSVPLEIARTISIKPSQFVYTGDTSTDMKTAVAAGMFPVGVTWGFRSAEELKQHGARKLISEPSELLDLF
jgi:phosphoglycolate phosphatase